MSNLFRAVTIDVEGNAEAVQWDTTTGTLTHLQRAVDGLVDLVALHEHVTMWVNDEGIVKGTKDDQPRQRGRAGRRHAEIM